MEIDGDGFEVFMRESVLQFNCPLQTQNVKRIEAIRLGPICAARGAGLLRKYVATDY
jgi:hypothetical protein